MSLLNENPNSTCLASLKQIQEELKSRTQISCGLEKITSDEECHKWKKDNAQFYSTSGSIERLTNCENYFKSFKTNAEKPVRLVKMKSILRLFLV